MPKMCGFAKHSLKDGVLVTDPKYYSFIRKSRADFRPDDEVCRNCRNYMEHMYNVKRQRARQLRDSRNGEVSTLSSSSMDSIDSLVNKTPRHKKTLSSNHSSQSINNLPSGLSNIAGSTQSNSQSLNGRRTESSILQANHSPMFTSSVVSENSPPTTVIRKNVQLNERDIAFVKPVSSRLYAELRNMDNDTVASPTIYDDEPTEAQYFRDSLNVRLSQEPTTSAAAAKAIGGESRKVTILTPKIRGIRDYFTPVQVNGSSVSNTPTSTLRPAISDATTATTVIARTQQTSASSGKRPLNGSLDESADSVDSDDEPRMSLNYYNPDVRYPQYQPIPKRRPFHHKHDKVMDIYLQGLTGG